MRRRKKPGIGRCPMRPTKNETNMPIDSSSQGPGLLNTATDGKQRSGEKRKPARSSLSVLKICLVGVDKLFLDKENSFSFTLSFIEMFRKCWCSPSVLIEIILVF